MPSPPPGRSEPAREFRDRKTPNGVRGSGLHLEARPALITAAVGLALIVAALAFGAVPLLVPGVGFVLLAGLAPAWLLLAGHATRVRRRLAADRVLEEEPLEAVVEITRGAFGLPGGELCDPLAGSPVALAEPMSVLPGRRRVALRVVTRVHRRGRHTFPPPELTLTDGFGLARLRRHGEGAASEVLVLPRTEPVRWRGRDHRHAASDEASSSAHEPRGAGEVDGLRQYMPGTPASRIHWPALARGAGLLERRLISESERRPLIVLDTRLDGAPRGEDRLDAAVRAAASLTLALARAGGCSLLLPGDTVPLQLEPSLAGWPAAHTRLALAEAEHDPARSPRLRPAAATGALIWVAASDRWPVPYTVGRGGRPAAVLVLPDSLAARRPEAPIAFEVSRCTGIVLTTRAPAARQVAA